jgi:hypothetical protein
MCKYRSEEGKHTRGAVSKLKRVYWWFWWENSQPGWKGFVSFKWAVWLIFVHVSVFSLYFLHWDWSYLIHSMLWQRVWKNQNIFSQCFIFEDVRSKKCPLLLLVAKSMCKLLVVMEIFQWRMAFHPNRRFGFEGVKRNLSYRTYSCNGHTIESTTFSYRFPIWYKWQTAQNIIRISHASADNSHFNQIIYVKRKFYAH